MKWSVGVPYILVYGTQREISMNCVIFSSLLLINQFDFSNKRSLFFFYFEVSQQTFTCAKQTEETLDKGVTYVESQQ